MGKKKEFEHYIFIDYSEDHLGYLIIERDKIKEFLPKISKFVHYKQVKHKKEYLKSIIKIIEKNDICSHFYRLKIRKIGSTPEIYSDILDFLKKYDKKDVFISIDNKQYSNLKKMVNIIEGGNVRLVRESELKRDTPEHRISLVLDTILNLSRLKNINFGR